MTKPQITCRKIKRKHMQNKSLSPSNDHGRKQSSTMLDVKKRAPGQHPDFDPGLTTHISKFMISNMHRAQVLGKFLQSLQPKGTTQEVQIHVFHSAIQWLPRIDLSPVLARAVDSLCLAHFGKELDDDRMTRASQICYGMVLSTLQDALAHSPSLVQRNKPRDILASIMLVGLHDQSTPRNHRSPRPWEIHLWGALQFLEARGPDCLDLDDPYDLRLLRNMLGPALALGLARRKSLVFSLPEWRALRERQRNAQTSDDYYGVLSTLPSLLEQADTLCLAARSNHSVPESASILALFAEFRGNVDACLRTNFYNSNLGVISTTDANDFDPTVEEHIVILSSKTFAEFYHFHDKDTEAAKIKMSTFCWLGLLLSETTVLRLLQFEPVSAQRNCCIEQALERAHHSADELCRSIYALSQFGSIAYAQYTDTLLQIVCTFFEDAAAVQKMVWCQMCMSATQIRKSRMQTDSPPTLCRIGDLKDILASAARFKDRHCF